MSHHTFAAFHASKHVFDRPDHVQSERNRENHDNGALGLWVAHSPDWIGGFGQHLYAIEFSGNAIDLPVQELAAWSRQHENGFHDAKRAELLERGVDALRVIEQDGRCEMAVIVNLQRLERFVRIDAVTHQPIAEEENENATNAPEKKGASEKPRNLLGLRPR